MSALKVLMEFGIFDEEGLARLAALIRNVQALSGDGAAPRRSRGGRGPGRRRGAAKRGPGKPPNAVGGGGGRKPRGSFEVSKEELAKLKETMSGKEIAEKHGVSLSTVQNRLREHGLTSGKRGRPAKKK